MAPCQCGVVTPAKVTALLLCSIQEISPIPRKCRVIYGSANERIQLLRKGLDEWAKITIAANFPDNQLYLAAYGAFTFIKSFALMTKHTGFIEEAEWRVIYVPEVDPNGLLLNQLGYHISPRGAEPKLKFNIASVLGRRA